VHKNTYVTLGNVKRRTHSEVRGRRKKYRNTGIGRERVREGEREREREREREGERDHTYTVRREREGNESKGERGLVSRRREGESDISMLEQRKTGTMASLLSATVGANYVAQ